MIEYIEIKKLFNIEKGSLQSTKNTEGDYDFITASSEWKTHKGYSHDTEALIVAVSASGSLGRVHYVDGKFIASDLCFILTPKSKEKPVNIAFYNHVFRSIRDDLVKSTATGTAKLAINKTNFGNYEVPYVDIKLQEKFEQELTYIRERRKSLLKSNNFQKKNIGNLQQQILHEAMSGKLSKKWREEHPNVESAELLLEKIREEKRELVNEGKIRKQKSLQSILDEEIPFELPKGWVWCRLGEVINIKSGKRIHASDYKDSGTPFLRSGEISSLGRGEPIKNQLYISQDKYEEIREKFGVPKPGDILIACIGGSIGNTWVVDDREFYYKDGNLVLLESIQFINTNYLLSYLSSPFFWNNTILNATSNSYNALTIVKLNHSIFPLPPQQEQQYIEKKIKSLFKKQDNLKSFNQENHENISLLDHVVLKEILKDKN